MDVWLQKGDICAMKQTCLPSNITATNVVKRRAHFVLQT